MMQGRNERLRRQSEQGGAERVVVSQEEEMSDCMTECEVAACERGERKINCVR